MNENILNNQQRHNVAIRNLSLKTQEAYNINQGIDSKEQVEQEALKAVETAQEILTINQFVVDLDLISKIQADDYVFMVRVDESTEAIKFWTFFQKKGEELLVAHGQNETDDILLLLNFSLSKLTQIAHVEYVSGNIFDDTGEALNKKDALNEADFISILKQSYNCNQEFIIIYNGSLPQSPEYRTEKDSVSSDS